MIRKILAFLLISSQAFALGTVTGGSFTSRKGESTFHPNDFGTALFGVRNDGDSVITNTDLTYGPLSLDSTGKLKVAATINPAPESAVGSQTGVADGASLFKMIAGIDQSNVVRPVILDSGNNVLVALSTVPLAPNAATDSTQNSIVTSVATLIDTMGSIATIAEQAMQTDRLTDIDVGQTVLHNDLIDVQTSLLAMQTSLISMNTSLFGVATIAEQALQTTALNSIDAKLGATLITSQAGRTVVSLYRQDYSTVNLSLSAYTQILAPTPVDISEVEIFDSCGETIKLAFGAASSEVDQLYISPGGNGKIPLLIPANTRVSIEAVSNACTAGEDLVNFYR